MTAQTTHTPPRDSLASLRISRPENNAPRRRGGWSLFLLLLLLLIGGGYAGYRWAMANGYDQQLSGLLPDAMKDRPQVQLSAVSVQTGRSGDAVVVATGYLKARQQARIGARATGRIQSIHFEEGSRVIERDTLAVLEHAELDATLNSSKASVAIAQAALAEQKLTIDQALRDKTRAESLWQQRGISESELEQARFTHLAAVARQDSLAAQLELSVARMHESEEMKENMFIRAPFSGTVISKDAEVGESILPGGMGEASGRGSVATIADLEHLEIECDVKEDFITRVYSDQQTEISVDAVPGKKYHGPVRKIIPMGDRARATIKVLVEIADADQFLFPEMSGSVYFLPKEVAVDTKSDGPRMFCPTSSVVADGSGGKFVWIVDADEHLQKLEVTISDSRDGKTEVVAGLSGNERVVTLPQDWQAGQAVKVIE